MGQKVNCISTEIVDRSKQDKARMDLYMLVLLLLGKVKKESKPN